MMKLIKLLIVCSFFLGNLKGQELNKTDYERALSYVPKNLANKSVYNLHTSVNWFADSTGLYFVDHNIDGGTYKSLHFDSPKIKTMFDHDKLAVALSKESEKEVLASNLELSQIENKNKKIFFTHQGLEYSWDKTTKTLNKIVQEESIPIIDTESPDGNWVAYVEAYNLYLRSTKTQKEYQLTFDGTKDRTHGSYYGWFDKMYGENSDRPERFNISWSPDSKYIYSRLTDISKAEKMYMLDYSQDSLFKPALLSYYRASPGDTNIVYYEPMVFDVEEKKKVPIDLGRNAHFSAATFIWGPKEDELIYRQKERGFLKETFYKINLKEATKEILFEEVSNIGIDNFVYWPLPEKKMFVFISERSGWRQIYLLDLETKKIEPLSKGNYFVQEIVYVDEKREEIFFLASGKNKSINPYLKQLYKVNFKGQVSSLTSDNLNHEVSFSPDGKYYVDNVSSISSPTKTILCKSKTGQKVLDLTKADASTKISSGWQYPETFSLIGKDKKTKIYGAIWKPTNFDPAKSYPIIDATYTGPHTSVFPKSFNRAFDLQSLAELGFILIKVDGLGTAQRSLAFRAHSYKNMGNNLEDHVLAIEYLASKYKWIDGNRVGIFGHSAGGYDAAHAMLAFPDTYKVAVASSADHDFRMEKAWWPEMYMGWPVDSTYHEVSNVTMAKELKGKLLLVHGALDDNVNASSTFKLSEALIKADKQFDLLIIPSQRHGYQGAYRDYFRKKRWNYFVEHLLNVEPIWDIEF